MNALFDINKQLIANPMLWTIFDSHPLSVEKSNDPQEKARREAFIYFWLNLFESIHSDYHHVYRKSKINRSYWEAWDRYIRSFLSQSSEAQTIARLELTQQSFGKHYTGYLGQILNEIQPQPSTQDLSGVVPASHKLQPGTRMPQRRK